jgi:hypothetical protein
MIILIMNIVEGFHVCVFSGTLEVFLHVTLSEFVRTCTGSKVIRSTGVSVIHRSLSQTKGI